MGKGVQPIILGLPDDFDLTVDEARALQIDMLITGASFEHGLSGAIAPLIKARNAA